MKVLELHDRDLPRLIGSIFPAEFKGFALEIGASDGVYLSNTLLLERRGWKVLCIEPNVDYYAQLKVNRALHMNVACSSFEAPNQELTIYKGHDGEPVSTLGPLEERFLDRFLRGGQPSSSQRVQVRTLDSCLQSVDFPRLDCLSLDVDGIEMDVLNGFDIDRWQTKVAIVENPFRAPAIKAYFRKANFELYGRTHVNDFWVRRAS